MASILVRSNVLVFTPVLRLETATVRALMALEWDGPLSLLFQRDNPTGVAVLDHLHQYQRGREAFLRGPYDALMVVESDIVPPADALQRLAALNVDLAYGCYLFRPGKVVNIYERYRQPAANMGESLTVRGLWESARRQGIIGCSGAGLGCILIQRHVIEEQPFEPSNGGSFFDHDWTQAVYRAGYSMRADTAVTCEHIDTDGRVYAIT
jgi:hypothetical protein